MEGLAQDAIHAVSVALVAVREHDLLFIGHGRDDDGEAPMVVERRGLCCFPPIDCCCMALGPGPVVG